MKITIAATADIHSPRYLPLFIASINDIKLRDKDIDIIIFAGDMVDKNNLDYLGAVALVSRRLLKNRYREPPQIIAVFGNEEYIGFEYKYIQTYAEIIWINDEYKVFDINNRRICIVGSRGILMKPTMWQQRNIPNIQELFSVRFMKINEGLKMCRDYDVTILVTHYASSFATIYGEPPSVYKFLGYPLINAINENLRPHLAIHGHAHNAIRTHTTIGNTAIYNVSLPANKRVIVISIDV